MKLKNGFLEALLKEIILQNHFLQGEIVETIYFGGGTPSVLSAREISQVLHTIKQNFDIQSNAEITLEANPEDITIESLLNWKEQGINRLSIGIQSFFEADLLWMNRSHSALQAERSILEAQKAGFDNLSIDLIFGVPGLSDDSWQANVQKAISLNIPHLSCYALTVEPKTPLEVLIKRKSIKPVNSEDQARQFLLLMEWLQEAGYEQYEISNYSLPGKRSRHNSSYWQGKKYLGLGPSAHSFNGTSRQWNISNNALYIQSLQKGVIPFEIEILTPVQKLNEWIMTSLRTREGLQLNSTESLLDDKAVNLLRRKTAVYRERYYLKEDVNGFSLTNEGKLFADGIAAGLFFEEGELM
jgi:oxygen-independent coproporphyrinogen-3 oxidase